MHNNNDGNPSVLRLQLMQNKDCPATVLNQFLTGHVSALCCVGWPVGQGAPVGLWLMNCSVLIN